MATSVAPRVFLQEFINANGWNRAAAKAYEKTVTRENHRLQLGGCCIFHVRRCDAAVDAAKQA